MRIAMVAACPFPWPRGTPIRIHRMAEALGRRGHDVHVVTYHLADRTPTPSMKVHRIGGPRWYTRTAPGPTLAKLALLDPLLTFKLRGLLRTISFDVIHAHHYEGLLAALCARRRHFPPIVFDSHTLLETELPHYGYGLEAKLHKHAGRALDRHLPRRAEHVVAVSDDMRAHYEAAGHSPSGITVIGNGVEVEHFRPNGQDLDHGHVLTFAGNLARYQRVDLLLEAFAQVRLQDERARLRILTADDFEPFAPLCERLGIGQCVEVLEVDYQALPGELRRATVLANPRIDCSGIPQKLMNYMASGTPVVSFGGSAKLLEHERSGLVVPDADVPAFAAAVLRLMADADLRRRLGACAQDIVAREYSWDQVARRVELVYARLAKAA
jgi:glycosyltransferase involved in cell wall biosynthesis